MKARYPDIEKAIQLVLKEGARPGGDERQVDTYFKIPTGKLKLREIEGKTGELIFYSREAGTRSEGAICRYMIYRTDRPEELREVLASALGVDVEVRKRRLVYWIQNVKVNVDEVEGLGRFVEFEAQADRVGLPAARKQVERLMDLLGIRLEDLVGKSYSDMIRESYL